MGEEVGISYEVTGSYSQYCNCNHVVYLYVSFFYGHWFPHPDRNRDTPHGGSFHKSPYNILPRSCSRFSNKKGEAENAVV